MMAILAFFAPVAAATELGREGRSAGQSLMPNNDRARGALELQPGKITRPAADERLRESQEHDQQSRRNGVELWLDASVEHVGESHAKCPAKHEVGNNTDFGQEDAETEKKNG